MDSVTCICTKCRARSHLLGMLKLGEVFCFARSCTGGPQLVSGRSSLGCSKQQAPSQLRALALLQGCESKQAQHGNTA